MLSILHFVAHLYLFICFYSNIIRHSCAYPFARKRFCGKRGLFRICMKMTESHKDKMEINVIYAMLLLPLLLLYGCQEKRTELFVWIHEIMQTCSRTLGICIWIMMQYLIAMAIARANAILYHTVFCCLHINHSKW